MKNLCFRLIQGKAWVFLLIIFGFNLQAQFVDFTDNTSKNRFLGLDMSMCKTTTNNSSKNYQKGYDCGNGTISELLNVNFLSPQLLGQQFYIFNDFIYWMSKSDPTGKQAMLAQATPDKYFSGAGVFMIVLGTSSYLKQIIAPDKTCPDGQTLMMVQLKYNDGNSLASWSQDAMCLGPTDTFAIAVSKDADNSIPAVAAKSATGAQGIDWMKDSGPASGTYGQADSSPRKVRLVLKSSAPVAQPVAKIVQPVVKIAAVK